MPKHEKRIEQPDKALKFVEQTLDFNEDIQKQQGLWD